MDDEFGYLAPDFEPSSLTIPRLRNILVTHDIKYSSSAKKAELIEIFQNELLPQRKKILAARDRVRRTSKGITDMSSSQETVDAEEVQRRREARETRSMPPPTETPAKVKAARKSRAATHDDELMEQSTIRKTPSRRSSKHPRASEDEGAEERPTVRKSRKSMAATAQAKAESSDDTAPIRPTMEDHDSPFNSENPFQSGASPTTPSVYKRKSDVGRLSETVRKSTSRRRRTEEPAGVVVKQESDLHPPSRATFEVPVSVLRKRREKRDLLEAGEDFTPEEQFALQTSQTDVIPRRQRTRRTTSTAFKTALWMIPLAITGGCSVWWRNEKVAVGYCGVGRPSSTLAHLRASLPAWISDNIPSSVLENIDLPSWTTELMQPQCEPCPPHAYCYADFEARCEPDFLLKPHPLSLGGLVPLPPTCEPDGEKVRRIQHVADKAVEELRERRAKFECGELVDEQSGKAPASPEVEEQVLKAAVSSKRRKDMSQEEFEELWKGAIGEILGRDEITSVDDG
jgi:hypothetical protein